MLMNTDGDGLAQNNIGINAKLNAIFWEIPVEYVLESILSRPYYE